MRRYFRFISLFFCINFNKSVYYKLPWDLAQYPSVRIIMYSIQSIKKPIIECALKKGILVNDCQLIPHAQVLFLFQSIQGKTFDKTYMAVMLKNYCHIIICKFRIQISSSLGYFIRYEIFDVIKSYELSYDCLSIIQFLDDAFLRSFHAVCRKFIHVYIAIMFIHKQLSSQIDI